MHTQENSSINSSHFRFKTIEAQSKALALPSFRRRTAYPSRPLAKCCESLRFRPLLWILGGLCFFGLDQATAGRLTAKSSQQAEALLSQMTLEEKIGQMTQVDMNAIKDKADIRKYGIGSVLSGGDSDPTDITAEGWRKACEEYQSW